MFCNKEGFESEYKEELQKLIWKLFSEKSSNIVSSDGKRSDNHWNYNLKCYQAVETERNAV